jgi:hypothetical protein
VWSRRCAASSSSEVTSPLPELRADCSRCVGLCCVALALTKSADFAIDKPAGTPCPNLEADYRCGIHAELRERGFPGCVVYDCFGAGQYVTQTIFGGRHAGSRMFAVFEVVRQLHELQWYLATALALPAAEPLHAALEQALEQTRVLTDQTPEVLAATDVAAHRDRVMPLLRRASELARRKSAGPRRDYAAADLVGARLVNVDLRGASLRGARLIGADLRGVDLTLADVSGADLRNTDLHGANLSHTLFVTQAQLDAARGDASTRLPASLVRPAHWQ